jgi:hypothetical protein
VIVVPRSGGADDPSGAGGELSGAVEPAFDGEVGSEFAASPDVLVVHAEARTTNANAAAMWVDLVTVCAPVGR